MVRIRVAGHPAEVMSGASAGCPREFRAASAGTLLLVGRTHHIEGELPRGGHEMSGRSPKAGLCEGVTVESTPFDAWKCSRLTPNGKSRFRLTSYERS